MSVLTEKLLIDGIPAILWGKPSEKVYLYVHGKMSRKEAAESFAILAEEKGYQTLSFDLPQHGDRIDETDRCDIWNGIRDLRKIYIYLAARYDHIALYGCSLGAFFSLHAYKEIAFERALFQSPIIDMVFLVKQMMSWFDITPERLEAEGEIDNPVDPLRWDYYQYIRSHPTDRWLTPTHILFGGKDTMQTAAIMEDFVACHGGSLTFSPESDHPFMAETDREIVLRWLERYL